MPNKFTNQKGSLLVIVSIIVLILLATALSLATFIDRSKVVQTEELQKVELPETNEWKTFRSNYGFEFEYPARLKVEERERGGQTGFTYCLGFFQKSDTNTTGTCYSDFMISGTSKDYGSGMSGGFLTGQGYAIKNNNVTFIFNQKLNKMYEIPQNVIKEVSLNKNKVEIVKVIGKNEEKDPNDFTDPIAVMGTPGEGYLGAIVNLPNNDLTGISFIYNRETQLLTEEEFNRILDTINYVK